jgi:transketolase
MSKFDLKPIAPREMSGDALVKLAENNDKILLINADLANACNTMPFVEKYPERSFEAGIAEQNQISMAAGFAHEGFMPFCFTMAPFMSMRSCEQVRTDVCYGNLPVRMIGTGAGYSGGVSGATHCALEDVAIFATMGGMTILEPADPYMLPKMFEASVTYEGPVYIRVGARTPFESLYGEDYDYQIGRAMIPREGNDGAFIVSGPMVYYAIEAADRLKEEMGVDIRVVDMHTIKPLDVDAVVSAAKTGRVVAAHDHNIIGGLGYMCAAAIAEAGIATKFKALGAPDHFVPIATTPYLYKVNEYDAEGLYKNMKAFL